MPAAFGVALVLIPALANIAAGLYVLFICLRSGPIDPELQERADMRSCSWPSLERPRLLVGFR